MENLKQEILTLIELKQEGEYWDFKKQWYDSKKKSDLLLDIICMANNLSTSDGYIIIGVDEENGYNIKDISEDENRKSTQNLVDFLKTRIVKLS
ncbi:ATP-binding protein [Streptococcus parauberis]|uniref:ATP-binding protein n=1 Tax=Streptococcus parauberis TaxID=1348 RepID=A0AAE4L161_9STRE|nr:ATP-binding protein [Streptococcus parauberis]MDT2732569.1 ATP-binding protein [Streptococcus parauberis]